MDGMKYLDFATLYYTEAETTAGIFQNVKTLNTLLSTITVTPGANIRLIGDELADRGENDYYMLKLIEKLHQGGANLEILLSNHGLEFTYERETQFRDEICGLGGQHRINPEPGIGLMRSMDNLFFYMDCRMIAPDEINSLYAIRNAKLKALSYDYDAEGNLFIYSHAPIDPDDILQVARSLELVTEQELPPEGVSGLKVEHFILMIDRINRVVSEAAVGNTLSDLMGRCGESTLIRGKEESNFVFDRLCWKRSAPKYAFPPKVFNVHGHDLGIHAQHLNLDGLLGKTQNAHFGTLKYRQSQSTPPAPVLTPAEATHTRMTTRFSSQKRKTTEQKTASESSHSSPDTEIKRRKKGG